MVKFPWKDEYSVNIARIDAQHKKLLEVVSRLHEGAVAGRSRKELQQIFAALLDYMLHHFDTEETLMKEHAFPGIDEHMAEHAEFRKKVCGFLDAFLETDADVTMDMIIYLENWLAAHVFTTDKKYSVFLNDRGVF